MDDIFLYTASVLAIVSTLVVLWRSSRSRGLSEIAYAAGIAGGVIVLASGLHARVPNSLIGVGFLLAVAAIYVWLFRRERARGGGALDALTIEYGARLSWFERGAGIVMGAALVMVTWLITDLGFTYRLVIWAAAARELYLGISGRPPRGAVRTATPNEALLPPAQSKEAADSLRSRAAIMIGRRSRAPRR